MTKCYLSATRNYFLHIKDKYASADIQFSFQGNTQLNLLGLMRITNPEHNYLTQCIYGQDLHQICWFKRGDNDLVFLCSNKTVKDAKEVLLKREQQKYTVYSLISGGKTQGQKR